MVHPSAREIEALKVVAREIRDTAEESGYSVDRAVSQHASFSRTRGPASALERSLILDAARRGATVAGVSTEEVAGSLDVVTIANGVIRRFRVKRVNVTRDGDYEVLCGEASTLLVTDYESIFREEKWIFGYVMSDDHTIDRLIAAEIVDWRGNGPVRLVFGTIIDLSDDQPPRGFVSTDEGLDGFGEGDGAGADIA